MSEADKPMKDYDSWSLGIILKHGLGDFAIKNREKSPIDLPFDIENACREIDSAFERLAKENEIAWDKNKCLHMDIETLSEQLAAVTKERDQFQVLFDRARDNCEASILKETNTIKERNSILERAEKAEKIIERGGKYIPHIPVSYEAEMGGAMNSPCIVDCPACAYRDWKEK